MEEEEDDGNIINYILDKLNNKIFKCYHLLLSLDNLIKNPAFYAISGIFLIVITCSMIFIFTGISNIRISLFKEVPDDLKIKKLTIEHYKRLQKDNDNKLKEKNDNKSSPLKNKKKTFINKNYDKINYNIEINKNIGIEKMKKPNNKLSTQKEKKKFC